MENSILEIGTSLFAEKAQYQNLIKLFAHCKLVFLKGWSGREHHWLKKLDKITSINDATKK